MGVMDASQKVGDLLFLTGMAEVDGQSGVAGR